MVIDLVLPERNESLLDAYESTRSVADAKACCDYAVHVGVTWWGPKVTQTPQPTYTYTYPYILPNTCTNTSTPHPTYSPPMAAQFQEKKHLKDTSHMSHVSHMLVY